MSYLLTDQQQAVLHWADEADNNTHLLLKARAGCGKTSTLLHLVEHLREQRRGSMFIGAFNKSIATELQAKLKHLEIPPNVCKAATMHGAGMGAVRRAFNPKVEDNKCRDLWHARALSKHHEESVEHRTMSDATPFVLKLVSFAKQGVFKLDAPSEQYLRVIDHHGMEDDLDGGATEQQAIRWAQALYRISAAQRDVVDYSDMLLFPLIHNLAVNRYDWVLIDEAQDLNEARRQLALKMLRPGGRIICVGDPAQAIYGFTGADSDSMDLVAKAVPNGGELPLNYTFRCPKQVVREANRYVPDLEAAPSNPEGEVTSMPMADFTRLSKERDELGNPKLSSDDAILCRNTAPLVSLAFQLIRDGVPCKIEGRDIGKGLLKLVKRFKSRNLDDLGDEVARYRQKRIRALTEKDQPAKAEAIDDQCATVLVLIEAVHETPGYRASINGLHQYVEDLFGDTKDRPVLKLMTIHKCKGLEFPRVFILGANVYQPSPWAKKDWQAEQEDNLSYVAITRAMESLVYINIPID